jgi:competence protein ComEA
MLEQFNLKQKIIGGIVIGIIVIGIAIYGFISMSQTQEMLDISQMVNLENTQNQVESENNIIENQNVIIVHITGEVKKTGILILPEGARIADAVEAAGGETKDADLDVINLAYVLEDGQKIYIPNKNEKQEKAYITKESGNNIISQGENNSKEGNTKVNINEANQSELEELPGIGPSIASRIIEYREQNGKFNKIEDLQNVKGIGDAKFRDIKDYVVVK